MFGKGILIPYSTRERKGGVTTHIRLYTHQFTTRNQQTIKQAPRYESSDQELAIKKFDRRRK